MPKSKMSPGGYWTRSGGLVQALDGAAFRIVPLFAGKRATAGIDVQLVTAGGFVVFAEAAFRGSMRRRNEVLLEMEAACPRLMSWVDGSIREREAVRP